MLFRVLMYINVVGAVFALVVCALAPVADSIANLGPAFGKWLTEKRFHAKATTPIRRRAVRAV